MGRGLTGKTAVMLPKEHLQLAQMELMVLARLAQQDAQLLLMELQWQEAQRDRREVLATAAAAAADMILVKIYVTTEPLEMAQMQGREASVIMEWAED